jgi:hypothetical protein
MKVSQILVQECMKEMILALSNHSLLLEKERIDTTKILALGPTTLTLIKLKTQQELMQWDPKKERS